MNYNFENTRAWAQAQDAQDPLHRFRAEFIFPQHQGQDSIYLCGNSLGLQPKTVRHYVEDELQNWATRGVKGHFNGDKPWTEYHKFMAEPLGRVVGAKPEEVIVMNTLTVNLHLLMVSFYRPAGKRFKIIMEDHAFPSDQYTVESQVRFHGYDPADAIIEVAPRAGEHTLRTEDILAEIDKHGDEIALVLFSGLQYYTGQYFDIPAITAKGHEVGAIVGWDLAHAAGNLPLQLHDWNVDFATWCSYKYLNSGPGAPSGAFVHERHAHNRDLPRFAGWWGHNEEERFLMKKGFDPIPGAAGWQLSNAPIMAMAPHLASLEVFDQAGIQALRQKSMRLTAYLEYLLSQHEGKFTIITPRDPEARGAQLSILTQPDNGPAIFKYISDNGVIADWREPNVIRVAPAPIYNSYEDVWRFADLLGTLA